jgi:hypothetical protein
MAFKLLLVAVLLVHLATARGEGGLRGRTRRGAGKEALRLWASSLTKDDYNASAWRYKFHSKTPGVFFDQYLLDFSRKFQTAGANINFAMVGACDGLADPTIRTRFLPNKHWRAVFVEPMTPNILDLTAYLKKHKVFDRRCERVSLSFPAFDALFDPSVLFR